MKRLLVQMVSWWSGVTLSTRLYTYFKGERVGEDGFGAVYYRQRGGLRRWVVYRDLAEPSLVPAEWHGWLHYQTDDIPAKGSGTRYAWQLPHRPNMTGTPLAYHPPGSVMEPQSPAIVDDDDLPYTPWKP